MPFVTRLNSARCTACTACSTFKTREQVECESLSVCLSCEALVLNMICIFCRRLGPLSYTGSYAALGKRPPILVCFLAFHAWIFVGLACLLLLFACCVLFACVCVFSAFLIRCFFRFCACLLRFSFPPLCCFSAVLSAFCLCLLVAFCLFLLLCFMHRQTRRRAFDMCSSGIATRGGVFETSDNCLSL